MQALQKIDVPRDFSVISKAIADARPLPIWERLKPHLANAWVDHAYLFDTLFPSSDMRWERSYEVRVQARKAGDALVANMSLAQISRGLNHLLKVAGYSPQQRIAAANRE